MDKQLDEYMYWSVDRTCTRKEELILTLSRLTEQQSSHFWVCVENM